MNIKSILSGLAIVAMFSAPASAQSMQDGMQQLMDAFNQLERDSGLPPGTFRNTPTNRPVGVSYSRNNNGRLESRTCYDSGTRCTPWR